MNTSNITLEEEDEYEFRKIGMPTFIYLLVVCVVGVIGNLHVIIVYSLRYKCTIYKIFVLCLASVDMLGCTFGIPSVLYLLRHMNSIRNSVFCKIYTSSVYFAGASSLMLLDVIAVERYRKVCQGTRAQFNVKTAAIVCACVMSFVFCLAVVPVTVIYGINEKKTRFHSLDGYECTMLDAYKNVLYAKIHRGIVFLTFIVLLIVCIILYVLVKRSIHFHRNKQSVKKTVVKQATNSVENDGNTTDSTVTLATDDSERNSAYFIGRIKQTENVNQTDVKTHNSVQILGYTSTSSTPNGTCMSQSFSGRTGMNNILNSPVTMEAGTTREPTKSNGMMAPCAGTTKAHYSSGIDRGIKSRVKKLNKSGKMTTIFLVISVISFGAYLPYLVFTLLRNRNWDFYHKFANANPAFDLFMKWMFFLNSAINPLIYGFMDTKFRGECAKMYLQFRTRVFHVQRQ